MLTPNVMDVGAPESVSERDSHERQMLRTLEDASGGRSVVCAVGLSLQEGVGAVTCHSLGREVVDPVGAYFDKAKLKVRRADRVLLPRLVLTLALFPLGRTGCLRTTSTGATARWGMTPTPRRWLALRTRRM